MAPYSQPSYPSRCKSTLRADVDQAPPSGAIAITRVCVDLPLLDQAWAGSCVCKASSYSGSRFGPTSLRACFSTGRSRLCPGHITARSDPKGTLAESGFRQAIRRCISATASGGMRSAGNGPDRAVPYRFSLGRSPRRWHKAYSRSRRQSYILPSDRGRVPRTSDSPSMRNGGRTTWGSLLPLGNQT